MVLARRCGTPDVFTFNSDLLEQAKNSFMRRVDTYFDALEEKSIHRPYVA